jgi:hypothetical protein
MALIVPNLLIQPILVVLPKNRSKGVGDPNKALLGSFFLDTINIVCYYNINVWTITKKWYEI